MPTKTRQKQPDLVWFQSNVGGAVHGFPAQGIAEAQANHTAVMQARAQKLPEPVFPRHPMEEIAAQIRTGKLVPCAAPDGAGRVLELSAQQIAALEAEEKQPETVAEKRARLLAELAELGDEDVPGSDGDVAGVTAEPGTTKPTGKAGAGK